MKNIFWSVKSLAKHLNISTQAVLQHIELGNFEAIEIGHDWRVFGCYEDYIPSNIWRVRRNKRCSQE